jgi:chromosome partitioning protein
MASIIAVYSMKGGVGKTTIAANLAYALAADRSFSTLLWDIDAQGAASFLLGEDRVQTNARRVFSLDVAPHDLIAPTRWPWLDLLASDLSLRNLDQTFADADKPKRLRKLLQALSPDYDRIVLDCPPGLGQISDQLFRAVDLLVVPVPPTPLALRTLTLIFDHLERHHKGMPPLLPVISMVDRRKKMHCEFVEAHPQWPVIPQASIVERMAAERAPLATFAAGTQAALAFRELTAGIEFCLKQAAQPKAEPRPLARIPKAANKSK